MGGKPGIGHVESPVWYLVPHDLQEKEAITGIVVVADDDHLLPRARDQFPPMHRHCNVGVRERPPQMGKSVVVVPVMFAA